MCVSLQQTEPQQGPSAICKPYFWKSLSQVQCLAHALRLSLCKGGWVILDASWELTATGCRIYFKNTVLEGSGHYTWVKIQNILKLQNNPISLMITYNQSYISTISEISEDCLSAMFLWKGRIEDLKVDNVFFFLVVIFFFSFFNKINNLFLINIK